MAQTWKERCREFMESDGGWDRLVRIARAVDAIDAMPALKLITEYAYGKPTQAVEADLKVSGGVHVYLPERRRAT